MANIMKVYRRFVWLGARACCEFMFGRGKVFGNLQRVCEQKYCVSGCNLRLKQLCSLGSESSWQKRQRAMTLNSHLADFHPKIQHRHRN